MDDQDDRGYSRAPEFEDLLALCKALNDEGVRYILIGGFAVILHGFVRARKEGNLVFDAQDAAVCLEHGARTLLTGDVDFARFPAIRVKPLAPF